MLFADAKELVGLDQYQVISVRATVRFWTLVLATYTFLEDERALLTAQEQHHVTLGQARRAVQRTHRHHLLHWISAQFQAGATPDDLVRRLVA